MALPRESLLTQSLALPRGRAAGFFFVIGKAPSPAPPSHLFLPLFQQLLPSLRRRWQNKFLTPIICLESSGALKSVKGQVCLYSEF